MIYLRQSTASQEIPLGHFVDDTDGKTAETGLTIANTDIKIWKTGATSLANKNSGGGTHMAGGVYSAVLDATDTDTVGPLVIFVAVSGALAVRLECCVLEEAMYDWMFGTKVPLSPATAGRDLVVDANGLADANMVKLGPSGSGTAQTARDIGASVLLSSGTGTGQVKLSSGYVAPNWGDVGNPTTTVSLSGTTVKAVSDGVTLAAAAVQAIWDAATSALTTAGSIGKLLVDNVNATISSRLASASYTAPPSANDNADALLDRSAGVETGLTPRQWFRLAASALFGKASGLGTTTAVYRDMADSKDRITATVDASGNRTAVTRDAT